MKDKDLSEEMLDALIASAAKRSAAEEAKEVYSQNEPDDFKAPKRFVRQAKLAYKYRNKSRVATYIKRIAAVFLIVLSVSFIVVITDPGIRASVFHNIFKDYKNKTEVHFEQLDDEDSHSGYTGVEIGYIPEGFEMIEDHSTHPYYSYEYRSKDHIGTRYERRISITVSDPENSTIGFSPENSDVREIEINGFLGYLFVSDTETDDPLDPPISAVLYGNKSLIVFVQAEVDATEILKIAKNIRFIYD